MASKTTPRRCMGAGRPSGPEGPHKGHVIILRGRTMLVLKASKTARPRRRKRWRGSHAAQRCTKSICSCILMRAWAGGSSLFCSPRVLFAGRRVCWHGDQFDDVTVLWRAEALSGRLPCCGGQKCLGTASRRPYGQRCTFGLAVLELACSVGGRLQEVHSCGGAWHD